MQAGSMQNDRTPVVICFCTRTDKRLFTSQVLIHFHVLFENGGIGDQSWCSASWLDNLFTVSSAQKNGSW